MTDSTSSNGSAVADFVDYLAGLEAEERKRALRAVEARVKFADADSGATPRLLSSEEAAERRALHINQTHEAIIRLGYETQIHRLGGSNANSTECRVAVASYVQREHGLETSYTEGLIRQIVSGRGDGLIEPLDACAPGDFPKTEFLIAPILYEANLHSWVGPEGSNKTILALWCLATLASQGKHVVLLEYEIAREKIHQLLGELGFDWEQLRPYFHDYRPLAPFNDELLWDVLAKHPQPAMLVLDSMAEAIAAGGEGDENEAKEALRVLGPLMALAQHGPAVLVLGHPPHGDSTRERGSSAKGPAVDVRFQLAAAPPVTLDRQGRIKLTCRKDRPCEVGVGTEIWYSIGSGRGDRMLPIEQILPPGTIEGGFTEEMAKVIRALEQHGELSANKALELAGLPRSRNRVDMLAKLADDPVQPVAVRLVDRGDAPKESRYRYEKIEEPLPY